MKKKNIKVMISVLALFLMAGYVQAQFSLTGEFRTRGEANNGYKYIPVEGNDVQYYASQRSRLSLNYKADKYDAKLTLQDVRAWGGGDIYSGAGVWGSSSGFDIYEAWVDVKTGTHSSIKVGRQELKYDDQRLLSWRNWNQYGLTYDAAVFKYKKDDWRIDAGLSYNSYDSKILGDTEDRNNYYYADKNRQKTLNFLYLKKELSPSFYLAFSGILAGYSRSDSSNTIYGTGTYGVHANYKKNGIEVKANAFLQSGHNKSGQEIDAYFFTADAGYKLGKFRLGAGVDIISGHDASNDDADYQKRDHVFNLMYGARFKYYGWINHFVLMDEHTKNGGLVDIYPNVTYKFNKKNIIKGYYHLFSLQNTILDGNGDEYDKSLGSELDLMYIKKISKEVNLKAGFSYSMPSETLEAFKGASGTDKTPYWGWVMLTVKPNFFSK